jgi:alkylated DNA repair dioxygenase AlkB
MTDKFTTVLEGHDSALLIGQFDENWMQHLRNYIYNLEVPPHPPIEVYGRTCYPKRNTLFFSNEADGYRYSGGMVHAIPLHEHDAMSTALQRVNKIFLEEYNGILLNKYVTSDTNCDYIGAHRDNESEIGVHGVVSISFGITRKFRVRRGSERWDFDLVDGAVAWMKGNFQQEFTHEIPVEKRRKGTRWSLTFRKH